MHLVHCLENLQLILTEHEVQWSNFPTWSRGYKQIDLKMSSQLLITTPKQRPVRPVENSDSYSCSVYLLLLWARERSPAVQVIYRLHQACRQIEAGSAPSSPADGCTDCVLDQTHRQSTASSMTAEPSRRTSRSLDPAALLSRSDPLPLLLLVPPGAGFPKWNSKLALIWNEDFGASQSESLFSFPQVRHLWCHCCSQSGLTGKWNTSSSVSPPRDMSDLTGHCGYILLLVKPFTLLRWLEPSFVRHCRPGCSFHSAHLSSCLRSVF